MIDHWFSQLQVVVKQKWRCQVFYLGGDILCASKVQYYFPHIKSKCWGRCQKGIHKEGELYEKNHDLLSLQWFKCKFYKR